MKAFLMSVLLLTLSGISAQNNFLNDQLVVKLTEFGYEQAEIDLEKKRFGIPEMEKLNNELGLQSILQIGQHKITMTFLLTFESEIDVELVIKKYFALGIFDFCEPNYIAKGAGERFTGETMIIPNDTKFNRQWGFYNNGTMTGIGTVTNDADVDLELAWNIQTGDPEMIIAVPDTGLRLIHPDIASRIWVNPTETLNGIDDDGNGLIDDINGFDFVNNDFNPTDDFGHGTNIAGIIGAIANNNSLYSGVNWNSKIMPIKVLDNQNNGTYSNMANSIYYAVDKGAKIISMSVGGSSSSTLLANAVNYAAINNVILVACMMNFNNSVTYYPAGFSTVYPNVIAVGSTNPDDKRSAPFFWSTTSGSNFGQHLNVVAPGNFIYSLDYLSNTNADTYWGGTSQATPLVAGIASLLIAQNPSATPTQIRDILQNTADDQVGLPSEDIQGFDQYMGFGRVNAFAALQTLSVPDSDGAQNQEFHVRNPIDNNVLQISSAGKFPGNYAIIINDMQGKLISSQQTIISAGVNKLNFDFAQGNYIVTLKSDLYSKVFKIVKH